MTLNAIPTAGVWLTAVPVDGSDMEAPLFTTALKRRLRVPVYPSDSFCPCCGDCLDRFGDHALVCPCKGDRTVRHNDVRNIVFGDALAAGLQPMKEKAGLLPARPLEDGLKASGNRRPADIWLPRGAQGRGEALDFACTSGMRSDLLHIVADTPHVVFDRYEDFKRSYQNTDQQCADQGFVFTPMVFEAHAGAWSPTARKVLDDVSKYLAAATGSSVESVSLRLAQRTSIALHKANARAILKRAAAPTSASNHSGWTDWAEDEAM
jgi:hypothetical protein